MAKKLSLDEAKTLVVAAINGAGGKMSHNDLILKLESEGNAAATEHIFNLAQSGQIGKGVEAQSSGAPVLFYKTGGA